MMRKRRTMKRKRRKDMWRRSCIAGLPGFGGAGKKLHRSPGPGSGKGEGGGSPQLAFPAWLPPLTSPQVRT